MQKIFFSDEAWFYLHGQVCSQNYRYYSDWKKERVSASSGSLMPREAAGRPGKAASDSRLLPRLIYKWLCTFVYYSTMWPPGYPTRSQQRSSGLHHLRRVNQQGAPFLETGKSSTMPGPDCMEDAWRCPNGIADAARFLSAGQYADVHCRATEKFHARACLFGKIT